MIIPLMLTVEYRFFGSLRWWPSIRAEAGNVPRLKPCSRARLFSLD